MGNCCFSFYLTQDLDRIAEANELFDAVLTGSVDRSFTQIKVLKLVKIKMLLK